MMSDTSTEVMERLASILNDPLSSDEQRGMLPDWAGTDMQKAAQTLRAIAAERDALKAELHETRMQSLVDFGKLQKACDERNALKAALALIVYETTHLSPVEEDGSHWCRITGPCLNKARAALQEKTDE